MSDDEFFNRRKRKGTDKSHRRGETERDNRDSTANSSSSSDPKLYGMPIKFVEKIIVVFGLIGVTYILLASNVFFAENTGRAIVGSILGIVMFIVMFGMVSTRSSILDIVIENVESFKSQFGFKREKKKITTSDQIVFLTKLAMDIIKHWKISWLIYTVVIMILYIIASYIGLPLTALLLLIVLMFIGQNKSKLSESFKKYLKSKTREIPAKPPSVGVMTLFGNPIFDLILGPGIVFVYPGIIDFLPIEVHQEPEDFEKIAGLFAKGDAKDGTEGNIPITVNGLQTLYVPELSRLEDFISAKEQVGVRDALKNMIASELRKIVSEHSFDELIGGKDAKGKKIIETIEEKLIEHLTGELVEDKKSKTDMAKTKEENDKIEADIAEAKTDMAKNGRSDVHLLGIKIHRISISSIETTDEYLKAMVEAAAEDKQRIGEKKDSETETMQADIYYEAYKRIGEPKTWDECLQRVMDNKSLREGHPITPGVRGFFESANIQKLAVTILEIVKEMKKQ